MCRRKARYRAGFLEGEQSGEGLSSAALQFAEPPCQDLNLGHRPMAYPRTDKVEVVWCGHDPALCFLSLTLPPARTVDAGLGDVQTIFPPARGR